MAATYSQGWHDIPQLIGANDSCDLSASSGAMQYDPTLMAAYHFHHAYAAAMASIWGTHAPSYSDSLDFGQDTIFTPSFEWYKSLESPGSTYAHNPISAASITPMGRGPRIKQSLLGHSDYDQSTTGYSREHMFTSWETEKWKPDLTNFEPWKIDVDSMSVSSVSEESMKGEKKWNKVPKLKEIRNLPRRRLCLQLLEDDPNNPKQWATKSMKQENAQEVPIQKSRPNKVLLSEDTNSEDATIYWDVGTDWVAKRNEKVDDVWIVTEEAKLKKTDTASKGIKPEEWAARFNRREKQVQVGKNTDGYRGLLAWRAKNGCSNGEPQTPRVSELSSKRQFDGRLSHWRILLHAFSPLESESDAMSLRSNEVSMTLTARSSQSAAQST